MLCKKDYHLYFLIGESNESNSIKSTNSCCTDYLHLQFPDNWICTKEHSTFIPLVISSHSKKPNSLSQEGCTLQAKMFTDMLRRVIPTGLQTLY
jgi:hypothetical protein